MITQNENGTWVVRGKLEEDRTIDIRSIGAAIASGMLAFMSLSLGLVLSSVNQRFLELERVVVKRIKR